MGCVSSSATSDSAQQPRHTQRPAPAAPVSNWRAAPPGGPARPSQPAEAPTRSIFGSQAELDAQRSEFWSSRVDGDPMVWMTLRTAAEACINNDIGTSEAILTASGINSPNGSLEVCYDERGHEYKIPTFCFSSSPDLIVAKPTSALTVEREEEEKCVRKGPPGAPLHLKVKINPGDHLLLIDTFENDTIAMLKQKIHEKSTELIEKAEAGTTAVPLCSVARQRMILMGKELKTEKQRLVDAKMDEAKVIQVFLKPLA